MKNYFFIGSIIVVFGLGVLFFVLKIDIQQLSAKISVFPKFILGVLALLSLAISFLKSWRFFLLLRKNKVAISFMATLKVYFAGQTTTPFPGGEMMRGFLIKKEAGVRMIDSSGAVITQAFLEFFSATILLVIGSFILGIELYAALTALGLICAGIYLITHQSLLRYIDRRLEKIKFLKKIIHSIFHAQQLIKENIFHPGSLFPNRVFTQAFFLALASHFLGGLLFLLIAAEFHPTFTFIQAIYIYCASIVISSLSGFMPGGLGFTDGGVIGILLLFGVDLPTAAAMVVIFRFINLFFYLAVGVVSMTLFYYQYFPRILKIYAK